jgi:hypothetical protein
VTVSTSTNVMTVSRCIAARSRGMPATTICSAAPCSNRDAATCVIAWREVRSLMPMRTVPLPIGMMSPPSKVASPWLVSGSPHHTRLPTKSGWNA